MPFKIFWMNIFILLSSSSESSGINMAGFIQDSLSSWTTRLTGTQSCSIFSRKQRLTTFTSPLYTHGYFSYYYIYCFLHYIYHLSFPKGIRIQSNPCGGSLHQIPSFFLIMKAPFMINRVCFPLSLIKGACCFSDFSHSFILSLLYTGNVQADINTAAPRLYAT